MIVCRGCHYWQKKIPHFEGMRSEPLQNGQTQPQDASGCLRYRSLPGVGGRGRSPLILFETSIESSPSVGPSTWSTATFIMFIIYINMIKHIFKQYHSRGFKRDSIELNIIQILQILQSSQLVIPIASNRQASTSLPPWWRSWSPPRIHVPRLAPLEHKSCPNAPRRAPEETAKGWPRGHRGLFHGMMILGSHWDS